MKLKLFISFLPTILFAGCASDSIIDSEIATSPPASRKGIIYTENRSNTVNSLSLSNVISGFSRTNPSSRATLRQVKEILHLERSIYI